MEVDTSCKQYNTPLAGNAQFQVHKALIETKLKQSNPSEYDDRVGRLLANQNDCQNHRNFQGFTTCKKAFMDTTASLINLIKPE